jgi:hypothetical protein
MCLWIVFFALSKLERIGGFECVFGLYSLLLY